jgi:N-acetylmuramoyl-L-alanine amidase
MRQITKIIIHCTATPEGREVDVDEIRKWHTDPPRNWSDIGYHFHIKLDGELQEGRPIERTGAHCSGQNYCSIGISYAGGMTKDMKEPKDTRTQAQREALVDLLHELKEQYPKAKIYGHRDFSTKACPSFDAKAEYEYISNC